MCTNQLQNGQQHNVGWRVIFNYNFKNTLNEIGAVKSEVRVHFERKPEQSWQTHFPFSRFDESLDVTVKRNYKKVYLHKYLNEWIVNHHAFRLLQFFPDFILKLLHRWLWMHFIQLHKNTIQVCARKAKCDALEITHTLISNTTFCVAKWSQIESTPNQKVYVYNLQWR